MTLGEKGWHIANVKSKKRSVCAPAVVYHCSRHGKAGAGSRSRDLTVEVLCLLADTRKPEPASRRCRNKHDIDQRNGSTPYPVVLHALFDILRLCDMCIRFVANVSVKEKNTSLLRLSTLGILQ
jgi:hypothetical protein